MKSYAEFLTEQSSSDVKAAAIAAIQAGKYSYKDASDEERFRFIRDFKAEGFTNANTVSRVFKSLAASGELFQKATGKAPAPKADPKSAQEKISPKELFLSMKQFLKSF